MFNNIKIAAKVFQTHRARTMLSVLGIVIGIMSVITIINAGGSLKAFIMAQTEVFGSDYIEVEVKVPSTSQASAENAGGMAQGIEITTLNMDDAKEIGDHPNIKDYYGGMLGQEIVTYQDINKVGLLWGVSEGFFRVDKGQVEFGRAFTEDEDNSLAQVVVLGAQIKQDLFGDDDALGKKITINKSKYRVIGVREDIGAAAFIDFDDMIILPINTLQKRISGVEHVSFIMASVADMSRVDQTTAEITQLMRLQHEITNPDKDDFAVISSKEAMEMMDTIFNALTIFLVAITSISLIVGGVGIMNIMYVSVLERTYEIGLRKSVGARSSDILTQFLGEAILVNLLGGVIGIILGIILTIIIVLIVTAQGYEIEFVISLTGIFVAVIFMLIIGVAFGFFPAKRAAELNPVDALRYE